MIYPVYQFRSKVQDVSTPTTYLAHGRLSHNETTYDSYTRVFINGNFFLGNPFCTIRILSDHKNKIKRNKKKLLYMVLTNTY
jgi:hypothetical protein